MDAWVGWGGAVSGGGGREEDRKHNLSPAAAEVGFSQQAVGMIPGEAQCVERDHGDDVPTLQTVFTQDHRYLSDCEISTRVTQREVGGSAGRGNNLKYQCVLSGLGLISS